MTPEVLQELVASLSGRDKTQITAATAIDDLLHGSLGRVRLEAALRYRLGVTCSGIQKVATFGDLCSLVGIAGGNGAGAAPAPVPSLAPSAAPVAFIGAVSSGLHVGIDIQDVAGLPETTDYWEHEFYKSTFSPREIAYALLQPSPRVTFAGQWCAKEALRKAHSDLAEVARTSIEVVHNAAGKPEMALEGKSVPGTLSVSHTDNVAVAVFVVYAPEQK
jgi:phosphopantetheine--protein transferase-like protein